MGKEKELVKNTAIIAFGKICTQLVSFFLLPLYTAILTAEEYGIVDLVITYSSLLLPFITLALEQALFRYLIDVRNNKEETSMLISTTIIFSLLQCLLFNCCIFIIYVITRNSLLKYFSLVLFGSVVSAIALQISRGIGDNLGYTLGSTLSAAANVLCNVLFLIVFHLGASGMMLAVFIGNIFCGIIIAFRCKLYKYIRIRLFNWSTLKELSKYSLPMIPNQLSWWALNAADKVIVQFFIGISGNGLIAVANRFTSVYIQFSNIFNISWTESAALHINDKDADDFFSKTINSVYKLFLSACCGIIACMPFVFPILINVQYSEAYGLIPIFMLASLFNVIVSLYGVIYVAHKKTVEIAKTAFYAATLNIISHLLLIKFIGIYAAGLSTMIGYGGMAIYRYFHSRKYLVIKFTNQTIVLSITMLILSFGAYYCNNKIVQAVVLATIVFFSVMLNRNILIEIFRAYKTRLRKA